MNSIMTLKLTITDRKDISAADARAQGNIPAVIYGPKQESLSVMVERRAFEKLFAEAGESSIVTLEGVGADIEVLFHDVEFDPQIGGIMHADFYAIERGKELSTNVSLEFIGEAPAERTGASVNKILHEVEVTCLPRNLPSHFDIDLSVLIDADSVIHVSDIVLPEGVTIETDPEQVIANVAAVREDEPEEEVTVDMGAIEVEAKGKGEEKEQA